jgi:enoyl-CoA hydratase
MCDITISSDDATYGYPVKRMNPRPTINLWPWIIGFKKTKELALTGRMIPAHEALQIGLINQVVPREHLDETVWQTAQVIARSCDKRWQKSYVNAVYERCMGVGAGLQLLVDGWEIDVSGDEIWTEWNRRIREEGLKSALSWRDGRFNEYDSFMRAAPARAATRAE